MEKPTRSLKTFSRNSALYRRPKNFLLYNVNLCGPLCNLMATFETPTQSKNYDNRTEILMSLLITLHSWIFRLLVYGTLFKWIPLHRLHSTTITVQ